MFKKIREKAEAAAICAQCETKALAKKLRSERGDTNFISILIILGIVLALAAVFIGFKDQIVAKVKELIDGNLSKIG